MFFLLVLIPRFLAIYSNSLKSNWLSLDVSNYLNIWFSLSLFPPDSYYNLALKFEIISLTDWTDYVPVYDPVYPRTKSQIS